ncbi:MAG: hypothetical protein R2932_04220 [Caldilineaceae bacterium]
MARSLVQRRAGYVALQEQVERLQAGLGAETVHLILEPTGGYEVGVALFAYAQGWVVTKPNPLTLRRWAEGVGYRAKTDPIDACAEYGYLMEPDGHALVPFFVRELDYLLRRLMTRPTPQDGTQSPAKWPSDAGYAASRPGRYRANHCRSPATAQTLAQTIRHITSAIRNCKRFTANSWASPASVQSVLPLIVILYRFDALSAGAGGKKQLTAFLGLDSQIRQSGTSPFRECRAFQARDTQMRARLYMCALGGFGATMCCVSFIVYSWRWQSKKVALVACARKILHWAWAIFNRARL